MLLYIPDKKTRVMIRQIADQHFKENPSEPEPKKSLGNSWVIQWASKHPTAANIWMLIGFITIIITLAGQNAPTTTWDYLLQTIKVAIIFTSLVIAMNCGQKAAMRWSLKQLRTKNDWENAIIANSHNAQQVTVERMQPKNWLMRYLQPWHLASNAEKETSHGLSN